MSQLTSKINSALLLHSITPETLQHNFQELLRLHPKKRPKHPCEERKKYNQLYDWYVQKLSLISEQLQHQKLTTEEAIREKQEVLLLGMRQLAGLASEECEVKGTIIDMMATQQLNFNNMLLKELDTKLQATIQERIVDAKTLESEYEDRIISLEHQLAEKTYEKDSKWKSMFMLIKDNRILRRARGKLMRAVNSSLMREKELQEQVLEVTRENQKFRLVMTMDENQNFDKIVTNMMNLNKLEKAIKQYPAKAKKVLQYELTNLQIEQMHTLNEKVEYVTKSINEAQQIFDYYEDLSEFIHPPKLLLNAYTQTQFSVEDKMTNTPLPAVKVEQGAQASPKSLLSLRFTPQVYSENLYDMIPKSKRYHSFNQRSLAQKKSTKIDILQESVFNKYQNLSEISLAGIKAIVPVFSEKFVFKEQKKKNTTKQNSKPIIVKRSLKTQSKVYHLFFNLNQDKKKTLASQNEELNDTNSTEKRNEVKKKTLFGDNSYNMRISQTEGNEFMNPIIEQKSESSDTPLQDQEDEESNKKDQKDQEQFDSMPELKSKKKIHAKKTKKESKIFHFQPSETKLPSMKKLDINENKSTHSLPKKNSKKVIEKQNQGKSITKSNQNMFRFSQMSPLGFPSNSNNTLTSNNTITQSEDPRCSQSNFPEQSQTKISKTSRQSKKFKKVTNRTSIGYELKSNLVSNFSKRYSTQKNRVIQKKQSISKKKDPKMSGFLPLWLKEDENNEGHKKKNLTSRREGRKITTQIYYSSETNSIEGPIRMVECNKIVNKLVHALFNKRKQLQNASTTLPNFIITYLKCFHGNNHQMHINSFFKSLALQTDPTTSTMAFLKMLNLNAPSIYLKDILKIYLVLLQKSSRENLIIEKQMGLKIIDYVISIFYKFEDKNKILKDVPFIHEEFIDLNEFYLSFEHTLFKGCFETEFSIFCRQVLPETQYDLSFLQLQQLTTFLNDDLSLDLHLTRLKFYCLQNNQNPDRLPIHKISLYTVREGWTELKNIKATILKKFQKIFRRQNDQNIINFLQQRFLIMKEQCPWLLRLARVKIKKFYRYGIQIDSIFLKLLRLTEFNLNLKQILPFPEDFEFLGETIRKLMILKEVHEFRKSSQL